MDPPHLSASSNTVERSSRASSGAISVVPHSNLYARGLPLDADEDQLASLFGEHGSVQSVRVFRSNQVGKIALFPVVPFLMQRLYLCSESKQGPVCICQTLICKIITNGLLHCVPAESRAVIINLTLRRLRRHLHASLLSMLLF